MIHALRINGVRYPKIELRYSIVDGYPGGPIEIAIHDPNLGEVTVSEDCVIEVQYEGDQPWSPITVKKLAELADKEKIKIEFP